MYSFDLAIAYKWIYDKELTELIEKMFQAIGLTTYIIDTGNYRLVAEAVKNGELSFKAILDRASDEDENFSEMAEVFSKSGTFVINDYVKTEQAVDKHKMHKLLEKEQFPIPYTIIVPPLDVQNEYKISEEQLAKLGRPFIIKPSYYSGGAEGVTLSAQNQEDIDKARSEYHDDYYLLQKKVYPKLYDGHRVWIRSYWFFNEVFLVWWDDETHIYTELTEADFNLFNLNSVVDYTTRIAEISEMDYFSSEFTIDNNDDLYLIDYVNDQCDMRMKPQHFDGVPLPIVIKFIEKMIERVKSL